MGGHGRAIEALEEVITTNKQETNFHEFMRCVEAELYIKYPNWVFGYNSNGNYFICVFSFFNQNQLRP